MNRPQRPLICSQCREDLQQGWTTPCGHAFCARCLNCQCGSFHCPIDFETSKVKEVLRDQRLCEALGKGDLKAAYEMVNTDGVGCREGANCEYKCSCPYSHIEEDLFQSMAPVFPEAELSHSARSGLEPDVLNEYLDIEGVEETPESHAYLQELVQRVSDKADMAYQWLKSL